MPDYSDSFLDCKRLQGDKVADEVVSGLFSMGYNPNMDAEYKSYQNNFQPIPKSFPEVLKVYFEELKFQADQMDRDIKNQGTSFFGKYASEIMASLGLLSLPYCYAAADGARVLDASERIKKNPMKRLMETASFVFDVTDFSAFEKEGSGIVSIAKVRLMHAAIRYHLLKSGRWNAEWGYPINQEDMAGTNLAFSIIVVRGLRRLGYTINGEESWPYLSMWNQIGELLGLQVDLLPQTPREAFNLEKRIANRQFRKSDHGRELTKALATQIQHGLGERLDAGNLMSFMLGEEVSQYLGLSISKGFTSLMTGLSGLNAIRSIIRTEGDQQLSRARRQYEEQTQSIELEPYRLLHKLTD